MAINIKYALTVLLLNQLCICHVVCRQVMSQAVATGEHGGLKLNANARAAVMNRLAGGSGGSGANAAPVGFVGAQSGLPGPPAASGPSIQWQNPNLQHEQGVLGPKSPIPTQCLLLKNMFAPAE